MTQPTNNLEGCVMLALSTFRRSEQAVEVALSRSREGKKLMVAYVIDINTARYLIGIEEEFIVGLKETCEAEILEKAEKEGGEIVADITGKAEKLGIEVKSLIQVGRFAVICLDLVKQMKPSMIVTTRSKRPEWVKKFFGAPVDELIAKAGCPVLAV
jgi:nucleotide-binding universal stress UspA family protein